MKNAVFIYNPNSGRKNKRLTKTDTNFDKIRKIFNKYEYDVTFIETEYAKHAIEIVKSLKNTDLIISCGGDGTFNEVITGNLKRKKPILVSHIPHGTTNDIGTMFGLGKDLYKNLNLILSGKTTNMDIGLINKNPFIYVAGCGKFLNIPYEVNPKLKKNLGHAAYLLQGISDFINNQVPLYEIEYEVNGEKYHGLFSLILVSNANRIAGINNFYYDIKLNDGKLEILMCNLKKKKDIIKSFLKFKNSDITKIPGVFFYKTDKIKIKFIDELRKPWCIDGESLNNKDNTYEICVDNSIKVLLPNKAINKLFVEGE